MFPQWKKNAIISKWTTKWVLVKCFSFFKATFYVHYHTWIQHKKCMYSTGPEALVIAPVFFFFLETLLKLTSTLTKITLSVGVGVCVCGSVCGVGGMCGGVCGWWSVGCVFIAILGLSMKTHSNKYKQS